MPTPVALAVGVVAPGSGVEMPGGVTAGAGSRCAVTSAGGVRSIKVTSSVTGIEKLRASRNDACTPSVLVGVNVLARHPSPMSLMLTCTCSGGTSRSSAL